MASLAAPSKNSKIASLEELCFREYLDTALLPNGTFSVEAIDNLRKAFESIKPRLFADWECASRKIVPERNEDQDVIQRMGQIYRGVIDRGNELQLGPYLSSPLPFICEKIEEREKELNLLLFFNEIKNQIRKEELPELSGDIVSQAAIIRSWIKAHPQSLRGIRRAVLNCPKIGELPPEMDYLTQLRELKMIEIQNMGLQTLPQDFNPPFLSILNISKTPIQTLPDSFNPPEMTILCLLGTRLRTFPNGFNPPHLERLYITLSPFKRLPEEFNPRELKILDLSNTEIEEIPERFNPPNLKEMNLENTPAGRHWKANGIPERFKRDNLRITL